MKDSPARAGDPMTVLTADTLFRRYFWPLYPDDVRADPERALAADANPSRNVGLVAHLVDAAELFVQQAPRLLDATLTWDAEGISRLSRALDRTRRDAWLANSAPEDSGNVFFNAVVHAAAYVGEVIVRSHDGAWSMRRPMWESLVIRSSRRGAIPPFHWLLKHLSDDEIDEGSLAYRFHVHVALAATPIDDLPVIATPRALPALRSPTYDLLVKYVRQHLPSLRDLGEGFPSPAEFTGRSYASVGFTLLHDGRALAMHGQSSDRVDVHWLTLGGFDHTDTIPADAQPPYFARPANDALEVTVVWEGRPRTHRVGFRGHG